MFIRWIVENVLLRSQYTETLFPDVHFYARIVTTVASASAAAASAAPVVVVFENVDFFLISSFFLSLCSVHKIP